MQLIRRCYLAQQRLLPIHSLLYPPREFPIPRFHQRQFFLLLHLCDLILLRQILYQIRKFLLLINQISDLLLVLLLQDLYIDITQLLLLLLADLHVALGLQGQRVDLELLLVDLLLHLQDLRLQSKRVQVVAALGVLTCRY